MVASFLEVHAVDSVAFNRICHGTPFLVQGDAFMVNSHAYLNINQALVNWIILIHHFAKSHRVPGIFSPRFKLMELTVPSVELFAQS